MNTQTKSSLLLDIWTSFRALPLWVILWMNLLLAPINMASIFFLSEQMGPVIALLAFGGMAVSMAVLILHRGFSKLVSGGHVLVWVPLVLLLIFARPEGTGIYNTYLTILLIANVISLAFDINDLRLWLGGNRDIPGHTT